MAQRQMARIAQRDVPGEDIGTEVINEEEHPDNTRERRKPGAPRLPGDESFPKADDATNPEKLAGNQHHEDGEEEQEIERARLAPTGSQPEGAKGNQRESNHSLVNSEEADHRRCPSSFS
jgi:hypothetical protein